MVMPLTLDWPPFEVAPTIVSCRAVPVLLASTYGRETWSSSGVVEAVPSGATEKSQPVPEIGSTGVSSWVVRPGQASVGVVAVSRFGLNVGLGLAFVPGSSTTARYMPGQGPCGIGQLNVSVDGTMASYEPSAPVRTVFSSRHLFGSYGRLTFGVGQLVPPPEQTVSTRA